MNNEWLEDIRRRMQEALSRAKRDKLRDEYGMEFEDTESRLSPEAENEWLDPNPSARRCGSPGAEKLPYRSCLGPH